MSTIKFKVDGKTVEAEQGTTLAAALINADVEQFRSSVNGDSRFPICGMGICHECRVEVNGQAYRRSCLMLCEENMEVKTK